MPHRRLATRAREAGVLQQELGGAGFVANWGKFRDYAGARARHHLTSNLMEATAEAHDGGKISLGGDEAAAEGGGGGADWFSALPREVLSLCFDYLAVRHVLALRLVARKWDRLVRSASFFWDQWRNDLVFVLTLVVPDLGTGGRPGLADNADANDGGAAVGDSQQPSDLALVLERTATFDLFPLFEALTPREFRLRGARETLASATPLTTGDATDVLIDPAAGSFLMSCSDRAGGAYRSRWVTRDVDPPEYRCVGGSARLCLRRALAREPATVELVFQSSFTQDTATHERRIVEADMRKKHRSCISFVQCARYWRACSAAHAHKCRHSLRINLAALLANSALHEAERTHHLILFRGGKEEQEDPLRLPSIQLIR